MKTKPSRAISSFPEVGKILCDIRKDGGLDCTVYKDQYDNSTVLKKVKNVTNFKLSTVTHLYMHYNIHPMDGDKPIEFWAHDASRPVMCVVWEHEGKNGDRSSIQC